jgi:hypothetical protein
MKPRPTARRRVAEQRHRRRVLDEHLGQVGQQQGGRVGEPVEQGEQGRADVRRPPGLGRFPPGQLEQLGPIGRAQPQRAGQPGQAPVGGVLPPPCSRSV